MPSERTQRFGYDFRNIRFITATRSSERAKAPADLFGLYKAIYGEDINIDTFRTTIWRMKDRLYDLHDGSWFVEGESGVYWKTSKLIGNIEQVLGKPFNATEHPQFGGPDDDEYVPDFDEEEDDSNIPF